MESNTKFSIGILSAFVIPTLLYAYTQGMASQSINELTSQVSLFKTNLDTISNRLYTIQGDMVGNTLMISEMNKKLGVIEERTSEDAKRISYLEAEMKARK